MEPTKPAAGMRTVVPSVRVMVVHAPKIRVRSAVTTNWRAEHARCFMNVASLRICLRRPLLRSRLDDSPGLCTLINKRRNILERTTREFHAADIANDESCRQGDAIRVKYRSRCHRGGQQLILFVESTIYDECEPRRRERPAYDQATTRPVEVAVKVSTNFRQSRRRLLRHQHGGCGAVSWH